MTPAKIFGVIRVILSSAVRAGVLLLIMVSAGLCIVMGFCPGAHRVSRRCSATRQAGEQYRRGWPRATGAMCKGWGRVGRRRAGGGPVGGPTRMARAFAGP